MSNFERLIFDSLADFMLFPCNCALASECWQYDHCFYDELEIACHTALDLGWY